MGRHVSWESKTRKSQPRELGLGKQCQGPGADRVGKFEEQRGQCGYRKVSKEQSGGDKVEKESRAEFSQGSEGYD